MTPALYFKPIKLAALKAWAENQHLFHLPDLVALFYKLPRTYAQITPKLRKKATTDFYLRQLAAVSFMHRKAGFYSVYQMELCETLNVIMNTWQKETAFRVILPT